MASQDESKGRPICCAAACAIRATPVRSRKFSPPILSAPSMRTRPRTTNCTYRNVRAAATSLPRCITRANPRQQALRSPTNLRIGLGSGIGVSSR